MDDPGKVVHDDDVAHNSPESSQQQSAASSATHSRSQSHSRTGGIESRRERPRVRFTAGGESLDASNQRSTFDVRDDSSDPPPPQTARGQSAPIVPTITADEPMSPNLDESRRSASHSTLLTQALQSSLALPSASHHHSAKPPFSVMRPQPHSSSHSIDEERAYVGAPESAVSQLTAQERAARLARRVGTSAPVTTTNSPKSAPSSPIPSGPNGLPVRIDDIPLMDLNEHHEHKYDGDTESDDDVPPPRRKRGTATSEAHQLVRLHTKKRSSKRDRRISHAEPPIRSGQVTPIGDRDPDDYVSPPEQYRGGILASLLKLYNPSGSPGYNTPGSSDYNSGPSRHGSHAATSRSSPSSPEGTPGTADSSGTGTPRSKHQKWYRNKGQSQSTSSLAGLMESSAMLATPAAGAGLGVRATMDGRPKTGGRAAQSSHSVNRIGAALNKMAKPRLEDEIRITVHIAETLSRQKYLLKLCRALMFYGAPTHRLEEYMKMTARVLEIDSQFLYIPGCMIISFDDATTHTTEVKLVRTSQGVDLGKLRDTHQIYKEVVHDVIGMEEATGRLDDIMRRKQKHHPWLLVLVYGLASACVGPFAFQARLIDLPLIFALGSLLGILQLIVAPKSDLYSNVFEISAAVLTSFLARAFGSIRGGNLFCFSAMAQSSIALILPGYTVLCGSLELQSKSIVAGSVRMVYAIIYSLFLGFGITIGTAIYGLIDPRHATSATQCKSGMPQYYAFLFVPPFTLCLIVINQAKWKQAPVMIFIAFAGYIVNFFSSKKFPSNAQISNTLGAFAIGVLGNLYSRIHHGMAAAAILPAIFVQVPSGLAASGSLVSGIQSANQITNSTNGTAGGAGYNTVTSGTDTNQLNTVVFNVGYSMIQVAIGITVGLFLSALVVYPFGKRRSGLFSF